MKSKFSIALLIFTGLITSSYSQDDVARFGLELNLGRSFATKRIDNIRLRSGYGFEGILHYSFVPPLGVYGGWTWNSFAADPMSDTEVCYEETGYVLGINYRIHTNIKRISYYLRAGGLYNHVETEHPDGRIIADTKHGLGFQAAGGIDIFLGGNWSLTPGIKFNSLSRNVKSIDVSTGIDYQYLSARIGITKKF